MTMLTVAVIMAVPILVGLDRAAVVVPAVAGTGVAALLDRMVMVVVSVITFSTAHGGGGTSESAGRCA